jgi:hypothetical protein
VCAVTGESCWSTAPKHSLRTRHRVSPSRRAGTLAVGSTPAGRCAISSSVAGDEGDDDVVGGLLVEVLAVVVPLWSTWSSTPCGPTAVPLDTVTQPGSRHDTFRKIPPESAVPLPPPRHEWLKVLVVVGGDVFRLDPPVWGRPAQTPPRPRVRALPLGLLRLCQRRRGRWAAGRSERTCDLEAERREVDEHAAVAVSGEHVTFGQGEPGPEI